MFKEEKQTEEKQNVLRKCPCISLQLSHVEYIYHKTRLFSKSSECILFLIHFRDVTYTHLSLLVIILKAMQRKKAQATPAEELRTLSPLKRFQRGALDKTVLMYRRFPS